jgi:hypothetical protein
MQLGLAAWHRAIAAGCPDHALEQLVAQDAVFHSPVMHTPQQGREKVVLYLAAAGRVFDAAGFRYVRELVDGAEACLEFEADLDGTHINGIDLIQFNLEGRIIDFKVMVRPMEAITKLWDKMTVELENT